ncbi:MAG: glutathione binding-like protein [Pseudomonadota bacterium]
MLVKPYFLLPLPQRIAAVAEESKALLTSNLQALDNTLEGNDYLVGNRFTAADIMMGYGVVAMTQMGLTAGFDNIARYNEKLSARESCKIAFSS